MVAKQQIITITKIQHTQERFAAIPQKPGTIMLKAMKAVQIA